MKNFNASNLITNYKISNGLALFSAFISFLASLLTIYSVIDSKQYYKLGIIFFSFGLFFFFFIKIIKIRGINKARLDLISDNYKKASSRLNETLYEMQTLKSKNSLNHETLEKYIRKRCQMLIDSLKEILCISTGENIYTTICLLEPDENNIDNSFYYFCSSCNMPSELNLEEENNYVFDITEQTEIDWIYNKGHKYAYFFDLKKVQKNIECYQPNDTYKSTINNWENEIKSSICIPIKINSKYIHDRQEEDDDFVAGFILVLSPTKNSFRKDEEKFYTRLIQSFSYFIFPIIERYYHYYNQFILADEAN